MILQQDLYLLLHQGHRFGAQRVTSSLVTFEDDNLFHVNLLVESSQILWVQKSKVWLAKLLYFFTQRLKAFHSDSGGAGKL